MPPSSSWFQIVPYFLLFLRSFVLGASRECQCDDPFFLFFFGLRGILYPIYPPIYLYLVTFLLLSDQ
ncbi:hypothetical protein GGR50DRAFT_648386 [Xylaria sp. CBS 124048]|nr:hypothetical protein GGR50DRAFT_648386 [Xylaria sp. CBS 124048]